ncbi:MAG: DDE-type integrase/transposase/recombinase [Gammaproteobacteria bacterium]|nr:DDE-type integrase/transposase/recombinase [Gammaproteobacteria bacterium]MCP5136365.1 DDE-type integrase/transposase/recombinase [Gammaproteobacteria bacterium]
MKNPVSLSATLIAPGAVVPFKQSECRILSFRDVDHIVAEDLFTRSIVVIPLSELTVADNGQKLSTPGRDLESISAEQWEIANERLTIIRPLLELEDRSDQAVRTVATETGVSRATLYRWIASFEESGKVSSLVRKQRDDTGSTRLAEPIEQVIRHVIKKYHLSAKKLRPQQSYTKLLLLCRRLGLNAPHKSTYVRRIKSEAARNPEEVARARDGRNAALRHRPLRGSIPGADTPYALIQIDHTMVDVILVDEVHRVPIGRPWITIAIDVFSRMVVGWYIAFDPPGVLGTGICISNAILGKNTWLNEHQFNHEWPCAGLPGKIHADNAKEFRGTSLALACQEWLINLQFRKLKKPNYGAHIERFLGTLLTEIHTLDGTTFSSANQRENYNSEANATMTISEFERWLAELILGVYHNRKHSELGTSPLAKYREGILGTADSPGIGARRLVTDPTRLMIDFLPTVSRTVQTSGIQIDDVFYYDDVLQTFIGTPDPENAHQTRKFICKRDPRDISFIYFYDPNNAIYHRIPYRNPSHPPMSLWELRAVRRWLKEQSDENIDEEAMFRALEEMHEIEEKAKRLTRKQALERERRRIHASKLSQRMEVGKSTVSPPPTPPVIDSYDPDDIEPYDVDDL